MTATLKERIATLAQFPHKERAQPYQSYFIDGDYVKGTRDTLYRFDKMDLPKNFTGISLIDLGAQLGAMSIEAYRRGARNILGLEYENDFLKCATELAQYNDMAITYKHADLKNPMQTIDTIHDFFGKDNTVDIVLALSLTKHVGTINLYHILRNFKWKYCFLEGHNCGGDMNTPHCQDIINNIVNKF
ncbi:hypothetical protein M0R04_16190, partial [Candidatus Dojkabacteria bacterium]|nr:hypothetical protein [Candidatus Dojkabacteria bacterium]